MREDDPEWDADESDDDEPGTAPISRWDSDAVAWQVQVRTLWPARFGCGSAPDPTSAQRPRLTRRTGGRARSRAAFPCMRATPQASGASALPVDGITLLVGLPGAGAALLALAYGAHAPLIANVRAPRHKVPCTGQRGARLGRPPPGKGAALTHYRPRKERRPLLPAGPRTRGRDVAREPADGDRDRRQGVRDGRRRRRGRAPRRGRCGRVGCRVDTLRAGQRESGAVPSPGGPDCGRAAKRGQSRR